MRERREEEREWKEGGGGGREEGSRGPERGKEVEREPEGESVRVGRRSRRPSKRQRSEGLW
jgi:hypothetical protein